MKSFNKIFISFAAALLASLTACKKEVPEPLVPGHVLMVYMAGDNNLSHETEEKLQAMKRGWNADIDGKIIIYTDSAGASPRLLELSSGSKGQTVLRSIKEYPEQNSSDKSVLADFINEVKRRYPAKSYGLLLFSHGSGWLPYGALNYARSAINDSNREMEIADMAQAIPDHAFRYIIFEACYMSSVEVCYQLRNKTDYILASSAEIVSPGFTELYPKHLASLFSGDIGEFGRLAFNHFQSLGTRESGATLSLISCAELPPLAEFLKTNVQDSDLNVRDIQQYTRHTAPLIFDFEDYYSRLLRTDAQKQQLHLLLDRCLPWKAATTAFMTAYAGFAIDRFSGLTTFIEQKNRLLDISKAYENTDWFTATHK